MRQITLFIILLSFSYGCNGSPTSEPSARISVSVSYKSGFQGDSLILLCDGAVFGRGRGFSDSIYFSSGYLFNVNEGVHTFEIQIPQMNAHADTTFKALPAYRTVIEASFDRKKKVINCNVVYLDSSKVALPLQPYRSIQSIMPR